MTGRLAHNLCGLITLAHEKENNAKVMVSGLRGEASMERLVHVAYV